MTDLPKLTAAPVAFSSTVGASIMLNGPDGRCLAILAIRVPDASLPFHETSAAVQRAVVAAINAAPTTRAARDVLAERERQISAEGWTPEHDDAHDQGELAAAGGEYAAHAGSPDAERANFPPGTPSDMWPFAKDQWKPKDRRADLVRAGGLILAELERIDRAAAAEGGAA